MIKVLLLFSTYTAVEITSSPIMTVTTSYSTMIPTSLPTLQATYGMQWNSVLTTIIIYLKIACNVFLYYTPIAIASWNIGLGSAFCLSLFVITIIAVATCVWARKKKRRDEVNKSSKDVILNTDTNLSYGVADCEYKENVAYGIAERKESIYEVVDL